jgi:hypothetical protein
VNCCEIAFAFSIAYALGVSSDGYESWMTIAAPGTLIG